MNKVIQGNFDQKSPAELVVDKCCKVYGLSNPETENVKDEVYQFMNGIYGGSGGHEMYVESPLHFLSNKGKSFGQNKKKVHSVILKLSIEKQMAVRR